jgi:hypothetical protein
VSLAFQPGDFLVFQLEAGYGLLRVLAVEEKDGEFLWHLAAYRDLFPDVESAEALAGRPEQLTAEIRHAALTNRAFESTQVSKIANTPLAAADLDGFKEWVDSEQRLVSDRSIRLLLGLR